MSGTVLIAQARMSSSRLPGKVLRDLGGRPVLDRVLERAARASLVDRVVLATSTEPADDALAARAGRIGVECSRGSLSDVLARYAQAAAAFGAETIVRITCDCPLIDPAVIDTVIAAFRQSPPVDYCTNTLVRTYPVGMDVEVFTREALERADAEASLPHEREHVTPYLYQRPDTFRLRNVEAPEPARRPDLRLVVDEEADLDFLQALVADLGDRATLDEVIDLVSARPELCRLNSCVQHREVRRPRDW